jgi:hypothetical protein
MGFYILLVLFYAVPYLLLAFLPGPRVLAIALVAGLGLCSWALFDLRQEDGIAGVASMPFAVAAGFGFVAGAIGRGLVLLGRGRGMNVGHGLWIHAALFVLVPALSVVAVEAMLRADEARRAEPAAACAASLHEARLGSVTLALPIARAILVGAGPEYAPSWLFEINEQAREFCEDARTATPQLTNVQVDLDATTSIRSTSAPSAFCRSEQAYSWWASSCRREGHEPTRDFPERTVVYVIGKYHAARMHTWSAEKASSERSRVIGFPQTKFAGGAVAYADGRYTYFTLDARPEFLASCYRPSNEPEGRLYCHGALPLGQGLGMVLTFRADLPSLAADGTQAVAKGQEVFDSLRKR